MIIITMLHCQVRQFTYEGAMLTSVSILTTNFWQQGGISRLLVRAIIFTPQASCVKGRETWQKGFAFIHHLNGKIIHF